jgi:hypothetical protein
MYGLTFTRRATVCCDWNLTIPGLVTQLSGRNIRRLGA